MPIVSISKIQHRYGLSNNGPSDSDTLQLSAAELGWEIDTRKLFIGNGPISEGAPQIGNTEILTEHSDILNIYNSYQYKGTAAGYTAITGEDELSPTTRTLQSKLDDVASVKDFGAIGDGINDDTIAINRAFSELFAKPEFSSDDKHQVRRSLFFPAGTYIVSDTIKIPSYAKVYGDGKNSSIIKQTGATPGVAFADSEQRITPEIGNPGPVYIEVNDIGFESTQAGDVLEISSSQNCVLRRVSLTGVYSTAPASTFNNNACVYLTSTVTDNDTRNILFEQCDFVNNVFGVLADDNMQGILFNACYFNNLHKGAKLGELTDSGDAGPTGIKITNSMFDKVYNTGIHVYDIGGVVSAYNYFADVANGLNSIGNPLNNTVIFGGNGNASINDIFDRNDTDDAVISRVSYNGKSVYVLNSADGVYHGYHKTEPGKSVTLDNNISSATSSGIVFSATDEKTNLIYYTATRGNNVRQGILRITASSNGSTLTDEYSEDGADIGLEFSTTVVDGTTTLNYTTTGTGDNITFKYRVERLT